MQPYDECVLCVSACITAHLHATLTLFHCTLSRSHIQLSSYPSPPTIKSRFRSSPRCESLRYVAAWPHLSLGLSGPCGASFCQCCITNNSPCYHYNHPAHASFNNKATPTKHSNYLFHDIIVDKMRFLTVSQVIPINTIYQ